MDKNSIKKYAVWARRELIARVSQRAEQYGITEQEIIDERAENIHGAVLTPAQIEQRQALIRLIRRDGYRQAMEEVAYTWFNRFMALRFMEVNDYLPGHTRAFTDDQNAFKPRILSDALDLELNGLDIDRVIAMKEANDTEGLYQYLLITLCNHLSDILPGMFQRINDYTELLFPEHLLREGSVLQQLIVMIPQEDWLDAVQIIGWLYQYYNAEPKDQVFANLKKNIKISKENIPAATQLFTPDWIVRYMVENSLGRLWVEGHPDDGLKANWKYYLEEAEQEPEVQAQLRIIRAQYAQMKPEEILCIDPCSGSGHILVYLFDVLVQIYTAYGYPTREAVASIVRNNLWGLDIDDRAAQLAYFAVMMKARQYDKGWFRRGIEPNVFALQNSPEIAEDTYARFGDYADAARRVIDAFRDAKEYGSIIQPNVSLEELDQLDNVLLQQDEMASYSSLASQIAVGEMINTLSPMIRQARALVQKYHVVVTNPPYMGNGNMGNKLADFMKNSFPDSKADICTVFIERCKHMLNQYGFQGMMTSYTWMFLSSFENMRRQLFKSCSISTLIQPEYHAFFDEAFVPICTFVIQNGLPYFTGAYIGLADFYGADIQEEKALEAISKKTDYLYYANAHKFQMIPGAQVAYWISDNFANAFGGKLISDYVLAKKGLSTGDINRFARLWFEVSFYCIYFDANSCKEAEISGKKWFPYIKGGAFRKWGGNKEYIVNWLQDGYEVKNFVDDRGKQRSRPQNVQYYFKKGITYSAITTYKFSTRYMDQSIFGGGGDSIIPNETSLYNYVFAFLNCKVAEQYFNVISPTMNYEVGHILSLPLIAKPEHNEKIDHFVDSNVLLSNDEWDSYETSWSFTEHPIVRWSRCLRDATSIGAAMYKFYGYHPEVHSTVELCFMLWQGECNRRFNELKANEEELNRIFIDIYGLQDELTPEVADKDVTVRRADLGRDIRSLISYAVGCMFGRYSLDAPGLIFAGGSFDDVYVTAEEPWTTGDGDVMTTHEGDTLAFHVKYGALKHDGKTVNLSFRPDESGVLPITDDKYFSDDIVTLFVQWVKTVFGENDLEDNLKFIASALYPNGGGTARDLIRQYFLNDFYKDHLKVYQKRPIYWLFDAGKKNSFKCLIYLHRYRPDTVARVRTDYVHEMQARYRTAMEELTRRVDSASGSERVKLQKQLQKVQAQDQELRKYEEKIHHYADMMLPLDLDDGVKVNYAKLQDVLAPIK